jgi:hypothetical protein
VLGLQQEGRHLVAVDCGIAAVESAAAARGDRGAEDLFDG